MAQIRQQSRSVWMAADVPVVCQNLDGRLQQLPELRRRCCGRRRHASRRLRCAHVGGVVAPYYRWGRQAAQQLCGNETTLLAAIAHEHGQMRGGPSGNDVLLLLEVHSKVKQHAGRSCSRVFPLERRAEGATGGQSVTERGYPDVFLRHEVGRTLCGGRRTAARCAGARRSGVQAIVAHASEAFGPATVLRAPSANRRVHPAGKICRRHGMVRRGQRSDAMSLSNA
mmetsp:Transcript_43493/g.120934  ORF Transcript_43493/g.120934 Transcript_43493/m.120934 type:complete len:226 (+) Transcript_43493:680-1357(+)